MKNEKGKPLTYWGGLKDRTCDHTNCREVCPECRPYHVSEDCEEVKNWDNFAEQKNLELLAEEVYLEHENNDLLYGESLELIHAYKAGIVDGYNKAKETLYTKEDMCIAFHARDDSWIHYEEFIDQFKKK